MTPRTQIVKIGALFLSQFGLLAALNFQLIGIITAYKMMELKQNLSLAVYLSARKTVFAKKEKKSPSSPSSLKAQVVLGYNWTHGPIVAKYDRGRCSRLVLEEKFSHV